MYILDQIITAKRTRLSAAKAKIDFAQLQRQAATARQNKPRYALRSALETKNPAIIAEIKRRSPSKGDLRPDLDPRDIALQYQTAGAAAISVLTEEDYFGGSLADLREVKEAVTIPVLRKDFVIDEYQVYEAAQVGADALLLIVAALDDATLRNLLELTESLGLDALVEVHTAHEMDRALAAGAHLIGVNNRNLQTFEVTLETSYALAQLAPSDVLLVTESGIATGADVHNLASAGYRGFLIGETFMRAESPGQVLRELITMSND
jgi:indole-3-glycerol phosphate synthase